MSGTRKLRVGLIVDDNDQSSMTWEIYERSKHAAFYEIDALIVNQRSAAPGRRGRWASLVHELRTRGARQVARRIGYALLLRIEKKAVTRNPIHRKFFTLHPLQKFDAKKIAVTPTVSPTGLFYSYSETELERIRAEGLDVMVRCGGGILKGGILDVCPLGILSYHHADNDVNRGGPPAFWEVVDQQASTGFIIQRLTEELDGGDVLVKGAVSTSPLYLLNQIKLYTKSTVFMHLLLEKAGRTGALPQVHPKRPYAHRLYKVPGVADQLKYMLHFSRFVLRTMRQRSAGRTWRWGVAYLFAENWKSAVLRKAVVIKNPPNHFLADPFVVKRGDAHYCFVEDFDYALGRAAIGVYEIDRSGHKPLGLAVQEDFHLSFPYLFEADGELYMCPESVQAGEIRIYKCVEFPLQWKLHKTIMRPVKAADTCIFQHGGKWWMLTNLDSSDTGEYGSELHAFHADSFDADTWTPHPENPVLFDSMQARNGGMIFDGGELYRVFQVQGFNMYGKAMGVARIVTLDEKEYREEVVAEIPAKFMDDISGTHTLSFKDGVVALDVARFERTSH